MITIELHRPRYVSNLMKQKVIDRYASRNSELYKTFGNFSNFRCFRILMQRIKYLVFKLNTPLRNFFPLETLKTQIKSIATEKWECEYRGKKRVNRTI